MVGHSAVDTNYLIFSEVFSRPTVVLLNSLRRVVWRIEVDEKLTNHSKPTVYVSIATALSFPIHSFFSKSHLPKYAVSFVRSTQYLSSAIAIAVFCDTLSPHVHNRKR